MQYCLQVLALALAKGCKCVSFPRTARSHSAGLEAVRTSEDQFFCCFLASLTVPDFISRGDAYSDPCSVRCPVPPRGSGKISTLTPLSSGKGQHCLETPREASEQIRWGWVRQGRKDVVAFGPSSQYCQRTSLLRVT